MRGVVFLGNRELEILELPDPAPKPGEVVLAMRASGLCGTDLHSFRRSRAEIGDSADAKVRGHEPCGVVAEVGAGVSNVQVGDRVMMYHYEGCGECRMCRSGYTQMCRSGALVYGTTQNGGHEDYLLAPANTCVALRDELSFEEGAACACGTGTAFHGLKRLRLTAADTLAIFGQGPVGASGTLIAASLGVRVIAIDVIPERLELARRLGASETIDAGAVDAAEAVRELTRGEGADAALETSGIPGVRSTAVGSTAIWGRVCFVGIGGETTLDISDQVIHKQLTLYGSWTFSIGGLSEVADFVVDRGVPLGDLITHRFRLEEAVEAYRVFDSGKTGKVVFVWD